MKYFQPISSADEGEGEPAVEEPQVEEEPAEPEKTPEPGKILDK
jgi:hypothetical protein